VDTQAIFEAEWAELVAAAQEEGELVLNLGGGAGRVFQNHLDAFQEKFELELVVGRGRASEQFDRILAERGNGIFAVDVGHSGATSLNLRLIPAGAIAPLKPLLFEPTVIDESLWLNGRHYYADIEQELVFLFSGDSADDRLPSWYNSDEVSEDLLPTSPFDLFEKPEWKGRLTMMPPTTVGAGGNYFTLYVHPEFGPEWVERFIREMEVFFTEDNRLQIDGLAKGKFWGTMGGTGAQRPQDLQEQGLPIERGPFVTETETIRGTGSSNSVYIFNQAPHPNAAKLYVNWLLSKEGQTIYQDDPINPGQAASLRVDIPPGTLDEEDIRDPNKDYELLLWHPDNVAKNQEATDFATRIYREVYG
jgi:ABC-type Fe3+ transport system substrate-binding protein